MRRFIILACAAGAAGLAGCTLEPRYSTPTVPAAAAFKEQAAPPGDQSLWKPAEPGDHLPRGRWWELFGDTRLGELEHKVAEANQDFKAAEAAYRQARSLVSLGRSAYLPTVTAQPSVTRFGGAGTSSHGASLFEAPLTASWEPDFWGQTRLTVKSAAETAQSSHAGLENELLSLQAEVASDYFSLESIDMQRVLLSSAAADYERTVQLTTTRFNNGVVSEADVDLAISQLQATRAQNTDLGIARAQLEHAIAVLVGESPSQFSLSTGAITAPPPALPPGLPSQLLQRRPDVASAERLAAAANARIGIARTAYFPTISLLASGGYENAGITQLFNWPSRFWSIGANAATTVFDFGRRKALREQAWAVYDQAVATYRKTALAAFQETEDDLAGMRLLGQEAGEQQAAVKAAEDSLRLVLERYEAGLVSYVEVITAQNVARTAEVTAAQILGRRMTTTVGLIRALGGGWDAAELAHPPAVPAR
jgi:NodT family efflux transporter outer membrane factor (OMF) lipoprotein